MVGDELQNGAVVEVAGRHKDGPNDRQVDALVALIGDIKGAAAAGRPEADLAPARS